MMADIERIMVKERIRKEISRITELAEDIGRNGLLHPVTVMEAEGGSYRLLAGLRRLRAVQSLGFSAIAINVVSPADAETALRIEVSENEQREDFTYSEKMDYARLLEDIEREKAKERMLAGKKTCDADPVDYGPQGQVGKTRDIVASKIGMGGRQYDRAKYIADNAPEEVIEQLDRGERSISGTYTELCAQKKAAAAIADNKSDADDDTQAASALAPSPRKELSGPKLPSEHLSEEEVMRRFGKRDMEDYLRSKEFNAMSPEEKVTELERQLFNMRVRAVAAESDLAELKLRHGIAVDHKDSIIESLKRQVAGLSAALDAAEKRLEEVQYASIA